MAAKEPGDSWEIIQKTKQEGDAGGGGLGSSEPCSSLRSAPCELSHRTQPHNGDPLALVHEASNAEHRAPAPASSVLPGRCSRLHMHARTHPATSWASAGGSLQRPGMARLLREAWWHVAERRRMSAWDDAVEPWARRLPSSTRGVLPHLHNRVPNPPPPLSPLALQGDVPHVPTSARHCRSLLLPQNSPGPLMLAHPPWEGQLKTRGPTA